MEGMHIVAFVLCCSMINLKRVYHALPRILPRPFGTRNDSLVFVLSRKARSGVNILLHLQPRRALQRLYRAVSLQSRPQRLVRLRLQPRTGTETEA